MRLTALATLLAAFVTTPELSGQVDERRWPMIQVGRRVRVGVADSAPVVADRTPPNWPFPPAVQRVHGTVLAIAPETLYVELSNTTGRVAIPRVIIQGVEMSLGRFSRVRSAFDLGTAGAVMLALFLPSFVVDPDSRWFRSEGRATSASAVIGFSAGIVFGLLLPYERWRIAWIPE
jgi:hypothetical protein